LPKQKRKQQERFNENTTASATRPTNDKLKALVRFLARRAAEEDYKALAARQNGDNKGDDMP